MQQLKERGVYTLLSEGKEFVAHAVFRGVYVLYEETDRPAPEYCYLLPDFLYTETRPLIRTAGHFARFVIFLKLRNQHFSRQH